MENHSILIKNIVLHILDTSVGAPVLSNGEIDSEQEGYGFVENLLQKMLADDNLKDAEFMEGPNRVRQLCEELQSNEDFIAISQEIARMLYEIISHQPAIPAADLICCRLLMDDLPFLGLLKLNYRTNYIHHVDYQGETNINLLVKQRTVLPGENQKPEEGILINLTDYSIRLVEKEYEIDGKKEYYLSRGFLNCSDELSRAAKVKIISQVAEKLGKKYNNEKFDSMAKLRKTVTENMEEFNSVEVQSIAREIFKDNPAAQKEYVAEIKEAGIKEERIELTPKLAERKFGSHKIKTDTGIEINFPATYYNNKEMIEFINHPNGTVSILIKNVGKISNK